MSIACIYGSRECDGCGWCFSWDNDARHDDIIGYRSLENDTETFVPIENALSYAMAKCGLRFDFGDDYCELDGEQCRKMLEEWYFGTDWLVCYGD